MTNIADWDWVRDYYFYYKDGNLQRHVTVPYPSPPVIVDFGYSGDLVTGATGGENFTLNWDDNGNMENLPDSSVTTELVYNWDKKLRHGQYDTDTIDLKYDPDGNRIFKDSSEVGQRKYIVDIVGDLPVILMEIDTSDSSIKKTYIYANAQIIAQHAGVAAQDNKYFYLHDRLGSVREIIDTSGDAVKYYTYKPFGETLEEEGTLKNPFKFAGQYFDDEIDEYYLRARQFDPHICRFTSRDPIDGSF